MARSITTTIILASLLSLLAPSDMRADTKYVVRDAAKMNALFNALGGPNWNRKTGWPVPTGESSTYITMPDHVTFATVYRTEGQTAYFEYYLKRFEISSVGAIGTMPSSISFDSLEAFSVSDTGVVGPFPLINSPVLKQVGFFNVGLTGQIPDYSCATLERVDVYTTKATGGLPAMSAPRLVHYRFSSNKLLTGPIGMLTAPKLTELEITFNDSLAGELFPLNFPVLEMVNIRYNRKLGGSISTLSFPKLTYCSIDNNALQGSIPEIALPVVTYIFLSNNRFTGSVPAVQAPLARQFDISYNKLTGSLPAFSLPNCTEFNVGNNQLSGTLPTLSMPKCSTITVRNNAFTGSIDALNLPAATSISADHNQFDATLPTAWSSTTIRFLNLGYNKFKGSLPAWTLPEATTIILERNLLSGPIPLLQLPKIQTFNMYSNRFSGALPALVLPEVSYLALDSNRLTDLPELLKTCPKIQILGATANRLTFAALERNITIKSFSFLRQDSVELIVEKLKDNRTLFAVKVDGTANTYSWYRENDDGSTYWYSDATNDTLIVPAGEARLHFARIRNTIVERFELVSKKHPSGGGVANPWVYKNLSFFAEGNEGWQVEEGTSVISNSGSVRVNELLVFEGSIKIDTEAVSISAEGKFLLRDVPLPGGGTGTFIVSEGKYDLKLLGETGSITNFANSVLSKIPKVAGISINISNIKLVGGRSATGISISGSIEIDGLTNGCHEDKPGPTKIEIEDLEYTKTDGPRLAGMKVEDLGLSFFPKFCVKSLEAKYEREKNKLSFGASVAMPFAEVGGGMALIGTSVDSIAWRIEATEAAVPLGNTNLGISGFFGSISGIQTTPLDVELGGVFVTMVPKDFVKFDLSGTFTAPATIGAKIDGKAIPTPGEDDQYQLTLKGSTKYDFAEGMAKLEGEAHLGTTDGEEYFLDGALKVDLKAASLAMKGELSGGYTIRSFKSETANEFPYDWLNTKLGLPKKVSTEAKFAFIKSRVLYGVAHLGSSLGDIEYVFDFRKSWRDPDFLFWKRVPATEDMEGGVEQVTTTKTAIVPANTSRMVIRIYSPTALRSSSLLTPSGSTITGTDVSKKIDYAVAPTGSTAFWTIMQPAAGRWTINVPQATTSDVIQAFVDAEAQPLTLSATQAQRNITLTWTGGGTSADTIAFFVAGTATSADGTYLGLATMDRTQVTIPIPSSLSVCQFTVEAQALRGGSLVTDTTDQMLTVPGVQLIAPTNVRATYYKSWKRLTMAWTPSAIADTGVKSYVIIARSASGEDRLLGEAFRWVGWVEVPYEQRAGDVLLVRAVNAQGKAGCPTIISNVVTDVVEEAVQSATQHEVTVIPHPIIGTSVVHIGIVAPSYVSVRLLDMQGLVVAVLTDNLYVGEANYTVQLDHTVASSGMYILDIAMINCHVHVPVVLQQ